MNREAFVDLVERLVQEGHITGPVTCQGRIPFLCIDNRTRRDLVRHLQRHNHHQKEPDVQQLSNGMFVAIPRSGNSARHKRAEQLLEALGLNPAEYL